MNVIALAVVGGCFLAAAWQVLGAAATRSRPGAWRAAAAAVVAFVLSLLLVPTVTSGGQVGLGRPLAAAFLGVGIDAVVVQVTGLLGGRQVDDARR